MFYQFLKFLHIIALLGFMMAHGASASVAFALVKERSPERVRALLGLSAGSYGLMYISLILLLITGIIDGIIGKWFGKGWIWVSLVLLILVTLAMAAMGSRIYNLARKAAGLPYVDGGKHFPAEEPASSEVIDSILSKGKPIPLLSIGFGGIIIITWLMIYKPF